MKLPESAGSQIPAPLNGDQGSLSALLYISFSNEIILTSVAQWAQGHDEDVEVNQRALIDKVLARYSGEFTGA